MMEKAEVKHEQKLCVPSPQAEVKGHRPITVQRSRKGFQKVCCFVKMPYHCCSLSLQRKHLPSPTVFIRLIFKSLLDHYLSQNKVCSICAVPHNLLLLYGTIIHLYFPQCDSLRRFVTTLQWGCHNSWERLPNGHLKLLSPVRVCVHACVMVWVRHNVDLRLVLSLPGDSGDSSQEPSCPYQVARKYLKSRVPGPVSSKGLLRGFWKNTTMLEWLMLMRGQRGQEEGGEGGERWAVVVVVVFVCSLDISSAIKCQASLSAMLLFNTMTHRVLLGQRTVFSSSSWSAFFKFWHTECFFVTKHQRAVKKWRKEGKRKERPSLDA